MRDRVYCHVSSLDQSEESGPTIGGGVVICRALGAAASRKCQTAKVCLFLNLFVSVPTVKRSSVMTSFCQSVYEMLTLYCAVCFVTGALRNAIEIGVYLGRFSRYRAEIFCASSSDHAFDR